MQIKTLCDIDANLEASRVNDKELADVPTFKPGFVQDLRRVLDDKDVDAVVIATPNHWHALAAIWALQAGKHVYVEKPASHTIWEGRRMVEAATRYGKVVQVGTMNRSRPAVRAAIKYIQDGGLGKVYMARGLCFKPRAGIGKYPDGPMAPGEQHKLNSIATSFEPPYDGRIVKVDYDLWLGPAPKRPFNRNRFHYNWHWHWGCTATATPAQVPISSTSRAGGSAQEHPIKVVSTGGYFGPESSQETPDTQTALYEYADGTLLEFGTRGEHTNDEGGVIGVIFYGAKGWLWIDETGRNWQSYQGPVGEKNEKGPGSGTTGGEVGLTTSEGNHMQNFVDAIRANDPKLLTCDILEGHSRRRCRTWRTSRIGWGISCASIRRPSGSRTTRSGRAPQSRWWISERVRDSEVVHVVSVSRQFPVSRRSSTHYWKLVTGNWLLRFPTRSYQLVNPSVCRAILVQENCCSTRSRAFSAIDWRSAGSSSSTFTAAARSRENWSGLRGSTRSR